LGRFGRGREEGGGSTTTGGISPPDDSACASGIEPTAIRHAIVTAPDASNGFRFNTSSKAMERKLDGRFAALDIVTPDSPRRANCRATKFPTALLSYWGCVQKQSPQPHKARRFLLLFQYFSPILNLGRPYRCHKVATAQSA